MTKKRKGPEESATQFSIGTKKQGNNGNMWEIIKTKKGIHRWKKVSGSLKLNKTKSKSVKSNVIMKIFHKNNLFGKSNKVGKIENNKFYEWKSYNNFGKEQEIPQGFEEKEIPKKVVNEYFTGNNEKNMNEIKEVSKGKYYLTHYNGGRPYLVQVKGNEVNIYCINNEEFIYNWKHLLSNEDMIYNRLVKSIKAQKVFIGNSPKIEMTDYSGGYGSEFHGNTVLVQISENKYVYISVVIEEITTKDEIVDFVSPVGNNDIPYPVALGTDNIYYLLENKKVDLKLVPEYMLKNKKWYDSYELIYNENPVKSQKIKSKTIHKKKGFY